MRHLYVICINSCKLDLFENLSQRAFLIPESSLSFYTAVYHYVGMTYTDNLTWAPYYHLVSPMNSKNFIYFSIIYILYHMRHLYVIW